ncbi:MAG: PHP domain-containing protein [Lachnospiraceae bacterium]|nr:PHP domain-containing protein [Lachnospiraceae bacterium]
MKKSYKTEFHVHTRYSKDSLQLFILMLLMCKLRGIDTLVVTDHDEVAGALRYKKGFRKHGVEIIVGEEIFSADGEIIGINLKSRIEPGLSGAETIRRIREQEGVVYVPHPYDEMRKRTVLDEKIIEDFSHDIDLIEVHNGRNREKAYDVKQNELAEKYGIKKIIGGDSHTFFELGRNVVLTERPIRSRLKVADLHDARFKCKDFLPMAITCTRVAKAVKLILRGDFYGLFRALNKKITGRG